MMTKLMEMETTMAMLMLFFIPNGCGRGKAKIILRKGPTQFMIERYCRYWGLDVEDLSFEKCATEWTLKEIEGTRQLVLKNTEEMERREEGRKDIVPCVVFLESKIHRVMTKDSGRNNRRIVVVGHMDDQLLLKNE
eukprot:176965-Hanusia_phi.AAC.1